MEFHVCFPAHQLFSEKVSTESKVFPVKEDTSSEVILNHSDKFTSAEIRYSKTFLKSIKSTVVTELSQFTFTQNHMDGAKQLLDTADNKHRKIKDIRNRKTNHSDEEDSDRSDDGDSVYLDFKKKIRKQLT